MRLIDANALIEDLFIKFGNQLPDGLCREIDNAPTINIPVARWDAYCDGQKVGYEKGIETVIDLFNKYNILLCHIDGKIVPVKNSSKQECYDLLYEIQELINWRILLWKKNNE